MKIRNTYKRITAAVLSAVLLLSLAACKESEKKPDTQTNKPSVTEKAQDTKPADQSDTTEQQKTPSEPKKVSPVYTDWSKLTPYEPVEEVYTYHAGYCGSGTLQARDDYGVLLPYVGENVYDSDEEVTHYLCGLVTDKGELVTDPVYSEIYFWEDFMVLERGYSNNDGITLSCTIASSDGHWVHELMDIYYHRCHDGVLITSASDRSLDVWDKDGNIAMHFDSDIFKAKFGEDFYWETYNTRINWIDNKVGYVYHRTFDSDEEIMMYLDFQSGTVMDALPDGYPLNIEDIEISYNTPEPPKVDGYDDLYPLTDDISGEIYFYGYTIYDENKETVCSLFDRDGNMLIENFDTYYTDIRAGLYSCIEDGCFCYRFVVDKKLVFRYFIQTNMD